MSNNRRRKKPQQKNDYNPPYPAEILAMPIDVLKLREETVKLLQGAGIATLRDLAIREEKDFYRIHTFNKKNLLDVKNALKAKKVAIKPTPEKQETEQKPAEKQPQGKNQKPEKRHEKDKTKDRYGVDNSFVMTTLPQKPPKPKHEKVKEEPDIYLKVNRNGKWGFKDRNNKQVVEPVYDEVFNYKENICCVEKDERFGFINRQGELIVPIVYDCATSFSEGLACVFKREKCGYINDKNETVVDFKFDAATPVVGGECRVKKDGRWGEMHIAKKEDGSVEVSDIRWIT